MLKKVISCLLALCLVLTTFVVSFAEETTTAVESTNVQKEFYVSVDGNDDGDGSKGNPFKTVDRARLEVQKYNDNMTGDIVVNIADGRYDLDECIEFGVEDSGSNGYNVIYKGERDNNIPTLSGGAQITGWTEGENGIWSAKVDNEDIKFIRDLYVNDYQGQRARNIKLTYGEGNYIDPNSGYTRTDGFYVNKGKFGKWDNIEDVELSWGVAWKSYTHKVQDVIDDPSNPDRYIVLMQQPTWNSISDGGKTQWLPQQPYWWCGFQVENAFELLDEPGEFYFNKKTRVLYYIPREGQDMNTAEVIAPKIERVVHFYGERPENKVHNIKFQDVRFAHTNFWPYEYQYQQSNQVERPNIPGAQGSQTPGGVQLDWADNITIESCVFYGIETIGLFLRNGVTNGNYHGNVFTDIGSGSFCVGTGSHTRFKYDNVSDEDPLNLTGENLRTHMSTVAWGQSLNDGSNVWRGTKNAASKGVIDYAWLDFEKAHTLDSITINFDDRKNQEITDEEQSNFEVLVSNDENFETYTTLAVCRGKADDAYKVEAPAGEKFRYMLIRKLIPEQFAIRSVAVKTNDTKAISDRGVCSYNYFSNNYIQRVAKRHYAAPGITTYFTNHCYIDNNEIYDTPYSAMSLGYLWNPGERFETSNNVLARYNRIERYHLFCNDGGGIYTLACQPDSGLVGNYLNYCGNTWGGIYHDSSSGDYKDYDNVIENTPYAYFNNGKSVQNLNISNSYTDGKEQGDSTTGSTVEKLNTYMPGFRTPEAQKIIDATGLKPEWEYIRKRVPEGDLSFPQGSIDRQASYIQGQSYYLEASEYNDFAKAYADTLLLKGTWGLLPWNYDISKKDSIQYWYDRWRSLNAQYDNDWNKGDGSAYEMYEMRDIVDEVYYGVKHLSLEDMKKLCDDALANISTSKDLGGYPIGAVEKFKTAYAAALKMPQAEEYEKYGVVLELEKAYQALYDAKYRADIDYVYVEGGKTEMDYANKNITITVGANVDLNKIDPDFILSNNAKVGANLSTITFNKPIKLAVYNSEVGKYNYWTVTIKGESLNPTGVTTPSLDPADWHDTNPNAPLANIGGNLSINNWYKVYTDKKDVFNGEINFRAKVNDPDSVEGIHFIVSAQSGDNLEYAAYYERNTYYDVALKDQRLELSSVKGGKSKLCFKVDNIGFNYGDYNDISIKINDSGKLDTVSVMINGKTVANNAYADDIGAKGYFGVMNLNQTVTLGK